MPRGDTIPAEWLATRCEPRYRALPYAQHPSWARSPRLSLVPPKYTGCVTHRKRALATVSLVWRQPCRCALVRKRQQCSMQGTWPAINRSIGKRELAKISKGRCGTWEVRSAPQVVSYEVAAYRCRVLSASATMRARPVGLAVYNQRCAATACQRPIVGCVCTTTSLQLH